MTDMCMHGLSGPENKLPHKRTTALLANFPLSNTDLRCDGHNGKAHQWTKGYLSKRYNNLSRLGYSQKWTKMFCRRILEDFVDYISPVKRERSPSRKGATGPYQSESNHTHISRQRQTLSTSRIRGKLLQVYGATARDKKRKKRQRNDSEKCQRCEDQKRGFH